MDQHIIIPARMIAFSDGFLGKDGQKVMYPKITVRAGGQIVELPAKGVDDPAQYLDKDVELECAIYPSKTKAASLRCVSIVLS